MEHRISAAELIKKLGDALERIRGAGDSFVVERNGAPVARLISLPGRSSSPVREALAAWRAAGEPDPDFGDDLDRIGAADRPPENVWAS